MRRIFQSLIAIACLFVGFGVAHAAVFRTGEAPTVTDKVSTDLFSAGTTVSVAAPVSGEIFAAGSTVTISNRPERSIFAAGNSVTISAGAGYDVFASGNSVTISGKIGHDVYAAGNTVVISDGADIAGDLHAAGASVVIKGTIHGNVDVAANAVTSSAQVNGYFNAPEVSQLSFTGGSIGGDVTYVSRRDAAGLDKVHISGMTSRGNPPVRQAARFTYSFLPFLFLVPMWFVLGLFLLAVMPHRFVDIEKDLQTKWGQQFLAGFLILLLALPLAITLALSVVGLPIAALVGFLVLVLLIVAKGSSGILFGRLLMRQLKLGQSWWAAWLIGTLTASLLISVPVIGPILLAVLFIGIVMPALGSLAQGLWWNVRARS